LGAAKVSRMPKDAENEGKNEEVRVKKKQRPGDADLG